MKEMMFGILLLFLILLTWGLGGIFCKIALKSVGPSNSYFLEALGTLTVALTFLIIVAILKQPASLGSFHFNLPALLFGIVYGIGTILFVFALNMGKASVIVPLTALYPAVTVILALFILNESISLPQGIGVVLAIIAGILLVS
jgi:transporter family protein